MLDGSETAAMSGGGGCGIGRCWSTSCRRLCKYPEEVDQVTLTAVFETVEDGWVQARVAELPAVITAAPTRREARVLLIDALREYLLADSDEIEIRPDAELEQITVALQVTETVEAD